MIMTTRNAVVLAASMFATLAFAGTASAASMSVTLSADTVTIGDQIQATVKIDSEGSGINASQGTLQFPKDILEVVSLDKTGSVFNFWLQDPTYSNSSGQIAWIGGSSSGLSGRSLQVLKINFRVKGSGTANLAFTDGAVTAADGSGTNVLSAMRGVNLNSAPSQGTVPATGTTTGPTPAGTPAGTTPTGAVTSTPTVPVVPPPPVVVIPPKQIVRVPTIVKNLPEMPKIQVSLYPDPTKWYNLSSQFFASWSLPADVSDVADVIDKSAKTDPTKSNGLYDNKSYQINQDGVWYLHVRFKNNVGWGPTLNYRLALDRTPPLPFDITVKEGETTDVPNPTIMFSTGDELSGIGGYAVRVDGNLPIDTSSTVFTLPLLDPGQQVILVTARDLAGNTTEKSIQLDILPIASPVITGVNKDIFLGEGKLEIQGTALAGAVIGLTLKQKTGDIVLSTKIHADQDGNWIFRFDQALKKGLYFVEVVAEDGRGAKSLVVKSDQIKVRERPLLVIGGIEVTQLGFFIGFFIALALAFGAGFLSYRLWRKQVGYRVTLAARDVSAAFGTIGKDVDKCLAHYADGQIDAREAQDMQYVLKKIKTSIDKTKTFIVENIEEIKD